MSELTTWQSFCDEIREYLSHERTKLQEIAWCRWYIGVGIKGHEEIQGKPVVPELSQAIGRSASVLWRCVQFAERFPDYEKAKEVIERLGSWRQICVNALPKRNGHETASNLEQAAQEMEEVEPGPMEPGERLELASAAVASADSLMETAKRLDPEVVRERVSITDHITGVPIDHHPKTWTKGKMGAYHAFLRASGSYISGSPDVVLHHYPDTVRYCKSEAHVIPVTTEEHTIYHDGNWTDHDKKEVVLHLQIMTACLWSQIFEGMQ